MDFNSEILKIKNLTIELDEKCVVKNADISLKSGRVTALVGESGSGKTLTALSILKLFPRTARVEGEMLFKGRDLFKLPAEDVRKIRGSGIAMVFQEPSTSMNPVSSVARQIGESIRAHQKKTKKETNLRILKLLNMVKLSERVFSNYPHELSGGALQRVTLAMALACDPEVLILDEATTALDVSVQKEILELVVNIQNEKNLAILFITHDFSIVNMVAHNVCVMKNGVIVEKGTKEDVLHSPRHEYTRKLIACVPKFGETRKRLPVSDYSNCL